MPIFSIEPISSTTVATSFEKGSKKDNFIKGRSYYAKRKIRRNGKNIRSKTLPEKNDNVASGYIDYFYGPVILVIYIVAPSSVTLLPVNNVITNPKYWYEMALSTFSAYLFLASAMAIETHNLLNPFKKQLTTDAKLKKTIV